MVWQLRARARVQKNSLSKIRALVVLAVLDVQVAAVVEHPSVRHQEIDVARKINNYFMCCCCWLLSADYYYYYYYKYWMRNWLNFVCAATENTHAHQSIVERRVKRDYWSLLYLYVERQMQVELHHIENVWIVPCRATSRWCFIL